MPVVGEGVAPAGVAAVEAGRALRARQRARAAAAQGGEGREAVVATLQRVPGYHCTDISTFNTWWIGIVDKGLAGSSPAVRLGTCILCNPSE